MVAVGRVLGLARPLFPECQPTSLCSKKGYREGELSQPSSLKFARLLRGRCYRRALWASFSARSLSRLLQEATKSDQPEFQSVHGAGPLWVKSLQLPSTCRWNV